MQTDVPIGILTRNRAVYLSATLRSVQASAIPAGVPLIVYDDTSDDAIARRFLDTADVIEVKHEWPKFKEWIDAGLGWLADNEPLNGIGGTVEVVQINRTPCDVMVATCQAIADLFDMHPDAPAVILLQDDIVVTSDWYERLLGKLADGGSLGILAGMHLDYARPDTYWTAQCYMITRAFFEDQREWFEQDHLSRKNCDIQLCSKAREAGFAVELLRPYVCQHIGVKSEVRPYRQFKTETYIRMGAASPTEFSTIKE